MIFRDPVKLKSVKMIHYTCICRGSTIICSQQKFGAPRNFEDIVTSMIPNIPTDQDRRTSYTSDK